MLSGVHSVVVHYAAEKKGSYFAWVLVHATIKIEPVTYFMFQNAVATHDHSVYWIETHDQQRAFDGNCRLSIADAKQS